MDRSHKPGDTARTEGEWTFTRRPDGGIPVAERSISSAAAKFALAEISENSRKMGQNGLAGLRELDFGPKTGFDCLLENVEQNEGEPVRLVVFAIRDG